MHEDKLSKYERKRLEALAQCLQHTHIFFDERPTLTELFKQVEQIEEFLTKANPVVN